MRSKRSWGSRALETEIGELLIGNTLRPTSLLYSELGVFYKGSGLKLKTDGMWKNSTFSWPPTPGIESMDFPYPFLLLAEREGFTKKSCKKSGVLPNRGGGGGVTPNQFFEEEKKFQGPHTHRTIQGHPMNNKYLSIQLISLLGMCNQHVQQQGMGCTRGLHGWQATTSPEDRYLDAFLIQQFDAWMKQIVQRNRS